MKIKGSQLFYLFVVVLVGSIYYFDYYKEEEGKKKKDQDAVIVPLLKDDVVRIELKNASGEFELVKSEKGWDLKKPIEDLAAPDETNGWVQSLTTEKSVEKIGEGESFEWATYGLDKPIGTLLVYPKAGNKIQLEISAKKNFEGNPFIKKNDEKVVYVGDALWSSLLAKTAKELREKKILRTPLNELESVVITQGKSDLQLNMLEGKWTAPAQAHWRLDQNKVREVVNAVHDMHATDFVLESDPDKEQMSSFGFSPPALKVSYRLKGEKVWEAVFGQDKNKAWYVWPKDLKRVAKVESSQVDKLAKASLLEMRDREEPFIFNKEDVKKVNIAGEKPVELSKEGENWKASVPGAVESEEVSQLLEHIRQLRVGEFLDGKPTAPGIESSKKHFVLSDTQGKNLLELKIGDSFKKKESKGERTYFYAKSSGYPDVIALKEEDVKTLETDKLFKTEAKPSEKNAEPGKPAEKNPPMDFTKEKKNQ